MSTALRPSMRRDVRKTVTVVFCDVAGSTSLAERLDPESLRHVMGRYFDRMRSVLEAHGGTVEKFIGDAVMAVFGIPVVHEDDALRAARAACEMQRALAQLNNELYRERSVTLAAHIGVNTGEVVAGDPSGGDHLITGEAVTTAARLEQAAAAGEVMIGQSTFQLVRDAVDAEPVDPLSLKGKAEQVVAYRLRSVRPGASGHVRRLESPLVGREGPLRMLHEAFAAAATDRSCRLVTVLGPAGIGKSRLIREFTSRIGSAALVLSGGCLSYGEGITYRPVREMAMQAAGIAENATPEQVRDALDRALAGSPNGELVAAHLAGLLGINGTGPVEAPWAVQRFLEAQARNRPLVAVFDDLQWAEPGLLDVIDHVAERSRDASILVLCLARPELLDARPGWSSGRSYATSVQLEPLSKSDSDRLIENILGRPTITVDIRRRIGAAAQGNPLFVEEMLWMLLDDGVLVFKEGQWKATVDLATVHVPPAVSALLASRLDRLSGEERLVLEAASVVGEAFERSKVRAILPEPTRGLLDSYLGSLLHKDLIRPGPSDTGAEEAFRFRHILLRDAAYAAIPKAVRADLHEALAKDIQDRFGGRASESDELAGYHLEQAHRLVTELGLRNEHTVVLGRGAFEHLAAAGRRAQRRGDVAAAAKLLGRASGLLDPDARDRLRIAWQLGQALLDCGSIPEATHVLDATIERARALGDEVSALYAECVRWRGSELDPDDWEASADRRAERFEELGDHQGAALAWSQKAWSLWYRLRMEMCAEAAERSLREARAAGDRALERALLGRLLGCRAWGPTPVSRALRLAQQTLVDARARGLRQLEARALHSLGALNSLRGEFEGARTAMEQARAILHELGHMTTYWGAAQDAARIEWRAGDLHAAARVLRESIDELQALGERSYLSTNAATLAELEVERGHPAEAERWIDLADRSGSPNDRATRLGVELTRGLALASDDRGAAETHLRRALALADETDAVMWRVQARVSLARLLGGRFPDEARTLAAEAVALSEGKEAPIWIERSRALLTELGAVPIRPVPPGPCGSPRASWSSPSSWQ